MPDQLVISNTVSTIEVSQRQSGLIQVLVSQHLRRDSVSSQPYQAAHVIMQVTHDPLQWGSCIRCSLWRAVARSSRSSRCRPCEAFQLGEDGRLQVPVHELMDGPNINILQASQSNLGALGPLADRDILQEQWQVQGADSIHGMVFDLGAVVGSLVLLTVLLVISFERILGLDRLWAEWLSDWRKKRQLERQISVENDRIRLETLLNRDKDDDSQDPGRTG